MADKKPPASTKTPKQPPQKKDYRPSGPTLQRDGFQVKGNEGKPAVIRQKD